MVWFEEGNLMDPAGTFWQKESYDVILLRNVLMYFSPEAAKEVIGRMAESLAPGGYLFLGPAETLRGISQEFHLCHTHETFYYRRRALDGNAKAQPAPRAFVPAARAAAEPPPVPVRPPEIQDDWLKTIQMASERIEDLTRKRGTSRKSAALTPDRPGAPARLTDMSAAMDLLRQERFADALNALPSESVPSDDVQLLRAVVLANTGKLSEAENACKLLLKSDELNAGAHYVMALCREHAGDRRTAGEHDQVAMYLDPSFAMPHLHMGLLAKRAGDFVTACRELHQATLLLAREDASRILLFGGGFSREALVELCRREFKSCGGKA
jgi:chemotaxis protein methyltransferase CheR